MAEHPGHGVNCSCPICYPGKYAGPGVPLPPEVLANALQDVVHVEKGESRPARSVKVTPDRAGATEEEIAEWAALAAEAADHLPVKVISPKRTTTGTAILHDANGLSMANLYGDRITPFDRYMVAAMNGTPALIATIRERDATIQHLKDEWVLNHESGQRVIAKDRAALERALSDLAACKVELAEVATWHEKELQEADETIRQTQEAMDGWRERADAAEAEVGALREENMRLRVVCQMATAHPCNRRKDHVDCGKCFRCRARAALAGGEKP